MLITLHRYIMRQLLGTMLMCWIALTLLITLGGGVSNLFKGEGLGAVEVAKLFLFFVPPAATLVLPVAAMFAAASTYGRMSADNEITACRAAGINIGRLFRPALFVGLAVAGITYYSWNYFIPRYIQAGQSLSDIDFGRIAANELRKNRPLGFKDSQMHADEVVSYEVDPTQPQRSQVRLRGVAVIEQSGNSVVTVGTVDEALIQADNNQLSPSIIADLREFRRYSIKEHRFAGFGQQTIGPFEMRLPVRDKVAFKDLPALHAAAADPTSMRDLSNQLRVVRQHVLCAVLYHELADRLNRKQTVQLGRPDANVEVSCEAAGLKLQDDGVTLSNASVKMADGAKATWYRAVQCDLSAIEDASDKSLVRIELYLKDVSQSDAPIGAGDNAGRVARKASVVLSGFHVPAEIGAKASAYDTRTLLDSAASLPIESHREADRQEFIKKVDLRVAQIASQIGFRATVAVSAIALVWLAGMLGAIFRGSQVLTAFGLSCLPAFVVIMVLVAGRNIAGKGSALMPLGLGVMWGVIVLLCIVTLVTSAKAVRR